MLSPAEPRTSKVLPSLLLLKANTYSGWARPKGFAMEDRFRHERQTEIRQVNIERIISSLFSGRSSWVRSGYYKAQLAVQKAHLPIKPDVSGPLQGSYHSFIHSFVHLAVHPSDDEQEGTSVLPSLSTQCPPEKDPRLILINLQSESWRRPRAYLNHILILRTR